MSFHLLTSECAPRGRYKQCRTTLALCLLLVLLCAAWVSPVSCATVSVLDFVSVSDSPRAKNFMKGFKAVLQDNNNQLHSGDTVAVVDPSNPSDLVQSLSDVASDNSVPLVLGPVTDETLLTLLNSKVTTSNHFVYLSPLTSSDLGLAYNPNVFFMQNTPLIQLAVMLNYLMAVVKASRIGVMYVAKPSDVDSQLALGPAEISFIKKHWGDEINVLEVPATASSVSDADVSKVLENNPEAVFIFDRQGATPATVDFFHKIITNAQVREKNTRVFSPYAASIPLVDTYTTAANNGEAVANPNNIIFATSNPVLLDNRFTFLQGFQNSMTSNSITDATTGTTDNVGLIEGYVAANVLMELYNQNYVNGMTRESFYNSIWNQNRYLIGKDFAEGPYAGDCTNIMVEQQFTCDCSQGARMLLLNHIIASPTAGDGTYTLTPITDPSANLSFPVGTPITEETAGGYVTGSRSDSSSSSSSSFPWWAILLCVLAALLLLLLLLLLLCCCCGWCCCAGCCKEKKKHHTGYENAPTDDKEKVTIVTLGVQHSDLLWDSHPKEMSNAMEALQKMTRDMIKKYHAYEATSSSSGDECTIVCKTPDDAVHLTHQLETRLQEYRWNTTALERTYLELDRAERRGAKPGEPLTPSTSPSSSEERADYDSTGYQGPRVGLGVHTGYVDKIEKDEDEEYVYQGHTVMMSAQAEHQTRGSRVLVSQDSLDDLREETRNEFDFIRTNLSVNNEAQQPVPLYELRTPITNQEEIQAVRRRSPTPLSREESEEPAHEKENVVAVVHERERSATPRLKSEERVDQITYDPLTAGEEAAANPEEEDEEEEEIRVVTTKRARLALIRAVEDEPHVDREAAVRRSQLQATEHGNYYNQTAPREPSLESREEVGAVQHVRHATPPLAALEADRYCGVAPSTPRDLFSASESQRHRTPTPEPTRVVPSPEPSITYSRRRHRRVSLHASEERAHVERTPMFTATESVPATEAVSREPNYNAPVHYVVTPLPITATDNSRAAPVEEVYATPRTAAPQSAREVELPVDTHRSILTETEFGARDDGADFTPRELQHTQYVTHVSVPDHLVARSEEPSKSKSPPPAGEEHQPSTTERPGTVVEPLFNLEDYRYPATPQRNDIGVQASLASDRRRPIDKPNHYEDELNELNERKRERKKSPSIHYEHGFPTELGDKVVPCFSEGNGLLFRIIDSKTNTWSYYNDTTEFIMIATLTIGRRSQFEVLDNFRTVWNPTLRKYEGEVVIKPMQTVRVLRGTINGYSIAYAARLASEMSQ